jgi:hypothetical protein
LPFSIKETIMAKDRKIFVNLPVKDLNASVRLSRPAERLPRNLKTTAGCMAGASRTWTATCGRSSLWI